MFLKDAGTENIEREDLQKMVEEHFEKMEIDKDQFVTEFFALPKDSYLDDLKRKNKNR